MIEIDKYLGLWNEQGSTPLWFSKGCKNTTATYSLDEKGRIDVVNQCIKDGVLNEARGKAFPTKKNNMLKVGFFPSSFPVFRADYEIRYVEKNDDEKYNKAIVTSGDSVWLLTRDENIQEREYRRLLDVAVDLGIDVSKVQRTR